MNTPRKLSLNDPSLNTASSHVINNKQQIYSKPTSQSRQKVLNNRSNGMLNSWKLFVLPQFRQKQFKQSISIQKSKQKKGISNNRTHKQKIKYQQRQKQKNRVKQIKTSIVNYESRSIILAFQQSPPKTIQSKYYIKRQQNRDKSINEGISKDYQYLKQQVKYLRSNLLEFFVNKYKN